MVISLLCLGLLVGGCNKADDLKDVRNHDQTEQAEVLEGAMLAEKYSLESDAVTIWAGFHREREVCSFEVTNPEEIQELIDAVQFEQWQVATAARQLTGMESYYIKFNDNTTIAMYDEVAYGSIGSGKPEAGTGNTPGGREGYYEMPQELLTVVKKLDKKYTNYNVK